MKASGMNQGNQGATAPAVGTGIIGWLASLYAAFLAGTLTVLAVIRGIAKGATAAASATVTTIDADHNGLDVVSRGITKGATPAAGPTVSAIDADHNAQDVVERGIAKGATAAAAPTVTALSADHNGVDGAVYRVGDATNAVTIEASSADAQADSNRLPTSARLQAYNAAAGGGTWDRIRSGLTAVYSTFVGFLNTISFSIYKTTPTVRTDGQGGPHLSDSVGNLCTIDKSRDEASGSEKVTLLNPDSTQSIAETLVDSTTVADGTYYPSSSGMAMDGYHHLSFIGSLGDDNAAHTTTLTLEVSNYGGATATDWVSIVFFDMKNNAWPTLITVTGNLTIYFACCVDNLNAAFYRFKIATTAANNVVKITQRRVY